MSDSQGLAAAPKDVTMGIASLRRRLVVSAAVLVAPWLGGCEGMFTADLAAEPPADPGIAEIRTTLLGLEFEKSGGSTETLEFRNGEPVNLFDMVAGTPMRLFTDEQLPSGSYTGVRLLFDDGADLTVVDTTGGEFEGSLVQGDFADVRFSVEDNERSSDSFTLTLDLRRSLTFDDSSDEYTLTPMLRATRTGDAAEIDGAVGVDCPTGTSLAQGGAVYVFAGEDVDPDDLDGVAPEPFASARVATNDVTGTPRYALRFLPAGDYTVALTCVGDEDALDEDDDLNFLRVANVAVDDGETVQVDLD
jgi:hypothetical protein